MYKVFFNDRLICLNDDIHAVSDMQFDYVSAYGSYEDLKAQLDTYFNAGAEKNLYIYHNNMEELYRSFESYFTFIHAAGGLVRNDKEQSLFIYRRGRWDLPKGKPKKKEKPEQTAIREVEEECNIQGVTITRFITSSYHIYYLAEDIILKRTDWFEMNYQGDQDPTPYEQENITDFQWLHDDQTGRISSNTFPTILEVIEAYQKIK